jgi:uncharacterized protein (DUF58 family)
MEPNELLKRIRTIELQTRGMTQHVFSGQYQSAFKGRGMSFSEVRNYQIGDDVRAIDWNVTARFREPFIKVFEEERELSVLLVIDVSGSMYFGKGNDSKFSMALEVAATLGFSAAKKNDKVGAIFVSDKVELYIPPKKGFGHVHFLLRKMIALKPTQAGTNLNEGLKYVRNIHKRRSICFVISDFNDLESCKDAFANTATKHDLLTIQITDAGEKMLPKLGFVRWKNAETGKITWVDTSSVAVQNQYKVKQEEQLKKNEFIFQQLKIDTVVLETGQDTFQPLLQLFKHRK